MPKASEVAYELRKLADALDTIADAEIQKARISFFHFNDDKHMFLSLAKAFPRPFLKKYSDAPNGYLDIVREASAMYLCASIPRSTICRLVEPAKAAVYECDTLLSADEESTLEVAS